LSPFIAAVAGGALYRLCDQQREWREKEAAPTLQITHKIGCSTGRSSHYDEPSQAAGSKRRTLRLGRAILSAGAKGRENLLLLPVFDKHLWLCQRLALLHLKIIPQASLQQKLMLLKGLGQYEDALETFQDHQPAENFAMFLETLSPHALIFTPSIRVLVNPAGYA
jgi:glucosamine--fructose-6-phosphate aminotransferase (isomerizing)